MHLGLCKNGDIPRHAVSNGAVPSSFEGFQLIWKIQFQLIWKTLQ